MKVFINWVTHYLATIKHKAWVAYFMVGFAFDLIWRAVIHDWSKFTPAESSGFAAVINELHGTTYNSPEYHVLLKRLEETLKLHYSRNSHHPQYFEGGINGMNLLDLLELYCDWMAAGKRHRDGCMLRSIRENTTRFSMSSQLVDIFNNTTTGIVKKKDS
jgi:hypothetical protein